MLVSLCESEVDREEKRETAETVRKMGVKREEEREDGWEDGH